MLEIMEKMTQGAQANLNGKIFENMMIPIFEAHGYKVLSESDAIKRPHLLDGVTRYVLRNAKYTTIYNENGKTEFVIVNEERRIRVENKYQSAAGSVDEKFVYTLLNAIEAYPEKEVIIVIDGDGYKPGARKWVSDHIKNNWLNFKEFKSIKLFTIMEFVNWFNKEME